MLLRVAEIRLTSQHSAKMNVGQFSRLVVVFAMAGWYNDPPDGHQYHIGVNQIVYLVHDPQYLNPHSYAVRTHNHMGPNTFIGWIPAPIAVRFTAIGVQLLNLPLSCLGDIVDGQVVVRIMGLVNPQQAQQALNTLMRWPAPNGVVNAWLE